MLFFPRFVWADKKNQPAVLTWARRTLSAGSASATTRTQTPLRSPVLPLVVLETAARNPATRPAPDAAASLPLSPPSSSPALRQLEGQRHPQDCCCRRDCTAPSCWFRDHCSRRANPRVLRRPVPPAVVEYRRRECAAATAADDLAASLHCNDGEEWRGQGSNRRDKNIIGKR